MTMQGFDVAVQYFSAQICFQMHAASTWPGQQTRPICVVLLAK